MDFSLSASTRAVRDDVRSFLDDHWPAENRVYTINDVLLRDAAAGDGLPRLDQGVVSAFRKALGASNLLGHGFPEAFDGRGGGALERFAVTWELAAAGAPFPAMALGTVAPALVASGDTDLAARLLPPILRGEADYAIGYTEPDAGSDLAALHTTAERDGEHYRVRGQKVFTSGAHVADFCWLAARTRRTGPAHQGISVLVVPLDAPGVTISPLRTMSGVRTNIVFFDDVRVPATSRVGDEHGGWRLITTALADERYTAVIAAPMLAAIDALQAVVTDRPSSSVTGAWRQVLARLRAEASATALLNWSVAWRSATGQRPVALAAGLKLAVTELRLRIADLAMEILGPLGQLDDSDPVAPLDGQFDRMYRHAVISVFTGGTNDVQRDIVAQAGLGLPRSR